jgi:uncharacterized membrane protein HdeD (DUF308 family)
MTQISFNQIELKLKGYVKENWGSPFIMAFILLLVVAAVFLSAGSASLADTLAVYGFYALVAGVLLQIGSFLKYRGTDDDEVGL